MLLSRLDKNRPKILIANTRKPLVASMPIIVSTHSYKIAFPAFLFDSVFVETWKRNSCVYNPHKDKGNAKYKDNPKKGTEINMMMITIMTQHPYYTVFRM